MNAARTVSESAASGVDLAVHERRVGRDPSPSPKFASSKTVLKSTGSPSGSVHPYVRYRTKLTMFSSQARRLREPGRIFSGAHVWLGSLIGRRSGHAGRFGPLQIRVEVAPPIFVNHIGQRDTANRAKPPSRLTDRQRGIGMHAGRQPERGFCFLLELQIERRQVRAEAERSRRQQHVLHRRVFAALQSSTIRRAIMDCTV